MGGELTGYIHRLPLFFDLLTDVYHAITRLLRHVALLELIYADTTLFRLGPPIASLYV